MKFSIAVYKPENNIINKHRRALHGAGWRPNWADMLLSRKRLLSSRHSKQTKRSNTLSLRRNYPLLKTNKYSRAVNNRCAWLQKYWGDASAGCSLLWCATVTPAPAQPRKCRKISSKLHGHFTIGRNAAASIALTLIRQCKIHMQQNTK